MAFQAFIAEPSVEALDMSVLHRFAWLDVNQVDLLFFAPAHDVAAGEFGTVIATNAFRRSPLLDDPVERASDATVAQAGSDFKLKTLPGEGIDDGPKQWRAAEQLTELWESGMGLLSTQVLQEFYINVTRKIATSLPASATREVVRDYATWVETPLTAATVARASEIAEVWQISFWDAMILAAAEQNGANRLLTEDMNAGQKIAGIEIVNPFLAALDSPFIQHLSAIIAIKFSRAVFGARVLSIRDGEAVPRRNNLDSQR